jgi:AraC family transcriptional regulator
VKRLKVKTTTKNEYLQSVYKVIHFIELNYKEELTLETLSKVGGFSKYHFHRIFKAIIGESIGEHLRRVRLQNTTIKFKTDSNITDIALSSGYETNSAFSKAFKKHFGVTPSEFSKNAKIKKGVAMIEPTFVEMQPVDILYVRKEGEYGESCARAWEVLLNFVSMPQNKNLLTDKLMRFGIGHDNPNVTEASKIRCDACISWDDKNVKPEGEVQSKSIDGGKYAMFLHKGAYEELKSTYDMVTDWIVESSVSLRDKPLFEKYLDVDPRNVKPEDLRTEIYVAVN